MSRHQVVCVRGVLSGTLRRGWNRGSLQASKRDWLCPLRNRHRTLRRGKRRWQRIFQRVREGWDARQNRSRSKRLWLRGTRLFGELLNRHRARSRERRFHHGNKRIRRNERLLQDAVGTHALSFLLIQRVKRADQQNHRYV